MFAVIILCDVESHNKHKDMLYVWYVSEFLPAIKSCISSMMDYYIPDM